MEFCRLYLLLGICIHFAIFCWFHYKYNENFKNLGGYEILSQISLDKNSTPLYNVKKPNRTQKAHKK